MIKRIGRGKRQINIIIKRQAVIIIKKRLNFTPVSRATAFKKNNTGIKTKFTARLPHVSGRALK
ncbi:MAG: hypothetical protein KAT88_00020 [Spirochaetes bacterium]|nr:hypothetical protein [Spirochaetota bacterium]